MSFLQKLNALELLNLIHSRDLVEAFPNVCVALRIYITLPTSVGYLRSNMTQERLVKIAILSIESDQANFMNYEHAIDLFA
ncbi:hypothetical protein PR048_026759 [Dryococelus australis]|uniref:Uncharacterized protein n=1 Tax=Dryococelus australis TaxID=614101 RepID=A0ABQ9GMA6_9NEOP|nr:hypothetical protein PR048_026759 [Dryococelus australis]